MPEPIDARGATLTERRVDQHMAAIKPPPTASDVVGALRQCFQPCCREKGISVVDMGLIESVAVAGATCGSPCC